jgi:hypothetical protein
MKRFLTITLAFFSVSSLSLSMAQRRPNEAIPLPEYYGLYIVTNRKLCSLTSKDNFCPIRNESFTVGEKAGPLEMENGGALSTPSQVAAIELNKGFRFINYQELFSSELGNLKLIPMLYIRNITISPGYFNKFIERSGTANSWDSAEPSDMEGERNKVNEMVEPISLRIKPLQNNMVLGIPERELTPGPYRVSRGGHVIDKLYFWIGNTAEAQKLKCVDAKYRLEMASVPSRFEPCGAESNSATNVPRSTINHSPAEPIVSSDTPIISLPEPEAQSIPPLTH